MIVESSFDFDTQCIGPYKLPVTLPFSHDYNGRSLPTYRFYEEMLKSETALAVVDINGTFYCIIERDRCYFISAKDGLECNLRLFEEPLDIPMYQHIGYRKTYPKNLSVYHYPWYLLQDVKTGEVLDFKGATVKGALISPHVGLYKNLIDTPNEAIYFNTESNEICYL